MSTSEFKHSTATGGKESLWPQLLLPASIVSDKLFVNAGQDLRNRSKSTLDFVDCRPLFSSAISSNRHNY